MCGTPNALSRSIVTPVCGLSLEATCPAGTPNVASLKKLGICDGAMCGAAVARLAYICSWSSLCGGRCLAASHSASCGASTRPLVPGGRMLRKPPASSVPYGCTCACAGVTTISSTPTKARASNAPRVTSSADNRRNPERTYPSNVSLTRAERAPYRRVGGARAGSDELRRGGHGGVGVVRQLACDLEARRGLKRRLQLLRKR